MSPPLRNVRGWFSVQFQFFARFKIKKARGLIWGGTPRFSLILRTHTLDVRDGPTEHSGYQERTPWMSPTDPQSILVFKNTHAHMHARTHAHMHAWVHAHMHTCTHACMHACTHAHIHAHMRACTPHAIRKRMHTETPPNMHRSTYARMNMHRCTHAHMEAPRRGARERGQAIRPSVRPSVRPSHRPFGRPSVRPPARPFVRPK